MFGIELVELEDKFKGSFILVNKIETDTEQPHLEWYDRLVSKIPLLGHNTSFDSVSTS